MTIGVPEAGVPYMMKVRTPALYPRNVLKDAIKVVSGVGHRHLTTGRDMILARVTTNMVCTDILLCDSSVDKLMKILTEFMDVLLLEPVASMDMGRAHHPSIHIHSIILQV